MTALVSLRDGHTRGSITFISTAVPTHSDPLLGEPILGIHLHLRRLAFEGKGMSLEPVRTYSPSSIRAKVRVDHRSPC
jgi:hypothetical protein